MITSTKIGRYGNLCNSMFQFAAVIGMAKKTGLDAAIPHNETYYDAHYECYNTSIFDGFNITIPTDLGNNIFKEVHFPFEYVDVSLDDFTDMVGYFQTEKYFESAELEIRNQFIFKDNIKEVIDRKIKNGDYPDPLKCTSIHIRLGDYVKKRDYHPAMSVDYYQAASRIAAKDNFIIFSDDIYTAKKMFGNRSSIFYSEEKDPFSALYHMSLCSNNIICNSTFGWWGAWLGEPLAKDKVVVAPKAWFGPGHSYNTKDIIPDRWKIL